MATIQIRVNDDMKTAADALFSSLGLDISTAVRMFLSAALAYDGIPFAIKHRTPNTDLYEEIHEARTHDGQSPTPHHPAPHVTINP